MAKWITKIFFGTLISTQIFGGALDQQPLELDLNPTDVIHWESGGTAEIKGRNIEIILRLRTERNFSIYVKKLKLVSPQGALLTTLKGPEPGTIKDPIDGAEVQVYSSGEFVINFESGTPFKSDTFELDITFLGCSEHICLFPYTQKLQIPTFFINEPPEEITEAAKTIEVVPETNHSATTPLKITPKLPESEKSFQQEWAEKINTGTFSIGILLLVIFLGGLATNLTPCVFPMIPITLRILGQQNHSKWLSSTIYAVGIVATYTTLGAIAGLSGGVFGSFSGGATFNFVLSAIFIFMALAMLGYFNFSFLQNLGTRFGSGKAGMTNTLLMGAGAGLVAAPCTGPILGGLLLYATKSQNAYQAVLYFFIYSLGFALPYVFLGGLASHASRIKVSPRIQVVVKITFSAVLFALALFYLKIPLRSFAPLKLLDGHWAFIGILFTGTGALLLLSLVFRNYQPKILMTIPCAVLGIGFFAGSQNLSGLDTNESLKISWHKSLETGIEAAKSSHKPMLIDGWADWCAACKEMDVTTYLDPKINEEISMNYVAVKLDFTELDDHMEKLAVRFNMQGLPVTLMVSNPDDLEQNKRLTGYISAEALLQELQNFRSQH